MTLEIRGAHDARAPKKVVRPSLWLDSFVTFAVERYYRVGGDIKVKMGSIVGETVFAFFSKTNSLQECVIVGGKPQKHSKSPNSVQLKANQRMCSDDENKF